MYLQVVVSALPDICPDGELGRRVLIADSKTPVLCWVDDCDPTRKVIAAQIVGLNAAKTRFKTLQGVWWNYAVPVIASDLNPAEIQNRQP